VKNKHSNGIKLYNILLPIWLLWLVPITWLIILPGNAIIDFLVTMLAMKFTGCANPARKARTVLLRVWLLGFLADFIGVVFMMLNDTVAYNPFENVFACLWVAGCILISAVCIYFFNSKFALKKANLQPEQLKKVALALAVFTAPYLFFIPTSWIY